jgi:hypothetical protein
VKQRKALAKWPDINSRFTVLTCETEESISTMFFVFHEWENVLTMSCLMFRLAV